MAVIHDKLVLVEAHETPLISHCTSIYLFISVLNQYEIYMFLSLHSECHRIQFRSLLHIANSKDNPEKLWPI